MPNKTVILIAYHFPPENTVGALRPQRFYKYLKRLGYQCRVVTAAPGADAAGEDITVVHDRTREFLEGVRQDGAPFAVSLEKVIRKTAYPGQLGTTWSRAAAKACTNILGRGDRTRSVVYSSFPPMGSHLAGLQVARKWQLPWIADFRDPMGIGTMLPPSALARKALLLTERAVVRTARAVLLTVESAREAYVRAYPQAKEKFEVIWNGFDSESQLHALPALDASKKVLIHAGSLYTGRNANVVVESIARLRKQNSPVAVGLVLRLIGEVSPECGLNEQLHRQGVDEGWIEMPNQWVAQQDALRMTQQADALLLLQPQSKIQVPGKVFEYVQMGRPILAVVPPESAVEWLLSRAGVPYVCLYTTDSAAEIDRKLVTFLALSNEPTRASEWFLQTFDAEQQARQLAALIERI